MAGETSLWSEVLMQAKKDYSRKISKLKDSVAGTEGMRLRRSARKGQKTEAAKWFLGKDTRRGSFLWVCEALGLESDLVLKSIRGKNND